ncbi:methyltransferase domain-containing protein [Deinococcus detaillensis]|uniref:Methyltransferase domain-containing protein n=1 Tax=Deinococcus detaillensis TaxID=2592048 RepID=A0A553UWV9_9DEIO|nr:methyltransferase domain-containing protein [Deinococcus detaillensis]TSA84692.1 methyltransferase domain-containing protein [Deinococcus detaillensis]
MTQPSEDALRAAQMYERYMVPRLFAPWSEVLLDFAEIREGERVLDVACGTGIVARQAAKRVSVGGGVSALDLNPAMLAVAREAAVPDAPNIDWQRGSAQHLPFGDSSFAAVLCQQGLQFFPDPLGALSEMWRVLKPGGRAALLVHQAVEHNPLFHRLNQAGRARVGVDIFMAPFTLGSAAKLEQLMADAGFVDIEIEAQSRTVRHPAPQQFAALILQGAAAAVPQLAAMTPQQRQQLSGQLQHDLSDWIAAHSENGELIDEAAVHLIRGRRQE